MNWIFFLVLLLFLVEHTISMHAFVFISSTKIIRFSTRNEWTIKLVQIKCNRTAISFQMYWLLLSFQTRRYNFCLIILSFSSALVFAFAYIDPLNSHITDFQKTIVNRIYPMNVNILIYGQTNKIWFIAKKNSILFSRWFDLSLPLLLFDSSTIFMNEITRTWNER